MGLRRWLCACLLGLGSGLAFPERAFGGEAIAVIASPTLARDSISLAELQRVYLGTLTRLSGRRVERFHLRSGSRARQAFTQSVLGQSEFAIEEYWIREALRGGNLPPRDFESARAMIDAVAGARAALGYVPLGALDPRDRARVRVLRLSRGGASLDPSDPAYPVRMR
jgi:ABC-type phosphate transport system substrate-binding protein